MAGMAAGTRRGLSSINDPPPDLPENAGQLSRGTGRKLGVWSWNRKPGQVAGDDDSFDSLAILHPAWASRGFWKILLLTLESPSDFRSSLPMKDLDPVRHPYFPLLLLWRGILAALALHAVLDKPFEAMLVALVVIGCFALFGEFIYARKLAWDEERQRREREREARERRAEEARQRFEAAREAELAKTKRSFGLDDDEPSASAPAGVPGGVAASTAGPLEAATRDVDPARKGA